MNDGRLKVSDLRRALKQYADRTVPKEGQVKIPDFSSYLRDLKATEVELALLKQTEGPPFLITQEQAVAFVEALTGWTELGDEVGKPKSPHAMTHFEAVLGYTEVPTTSEARAVFGARGRDMTERSFLGHRVRRFAQYLREMADVLAGRADCGEGTAE